MGEQNRADHALRRDLPEAKVTPEETAGAKELVKPYEPTKGEQSALEAHRRRRRKLAPRMKVSMKKDVASISPDHPDEAVGNSLLMEALGTADTDFATGLLRQLANAGAKGRVVDGDGFNFMLAMVRGIEPRDEVEALLAAQMATVHNAIMTFARRLNHVENIPQQDSAERAFNKLARTFATQVEALKRYRSGGEQTVRVEHVTVNEGGQAIVGNVTHGGGAPPRKRDHPHETGVFLPKSSAVFGNLEAHARTVQSSGGAGLDRVPVPRRTRRSAEGQG